jgi:hypothetical protein
MTRVEVETMRSREDGQRRPELAEVLREPTTPAVLLEAVRDRMIGARQRENRAPATTAALIRERLPELAAQTIADANQTLAGRLVLPGTGAQPYFVGNPPDWFANPVNDNEYRWLLNRHGHWRNLLGAYSLTEDRRYGEKVVQEVRDWIARVARPPIELDPDVARPIFRGISPWRLLETGIRMFESWPLILEHVIDCDLMTPELLAEYVTSLYEHGEALAEVSPVLFPDADHNMHIMQNLGLLTIATNVPELKTAEVWKAQAIRELERSARVQITDGGGQIEGCPHYHNVCLHYLSRAQSILNGIGERLSDGYADLVKRGLDYSVHAFRPSGTGVPWGDSDADLRAVTAAFHAGLAFGHWEPLQRLTVLAGREAARDECLKSVWRNPHLPVFLREFEQSSSPPATPLPTVVWHRKLGQVTMRTDWTRDALSLFFACHTPTSTSGHAHIDPMGFDFTALGSPLVVDPGRYCYRRDDDRRTFKTAAYHNTLTIDRTDPYPYLESGRNGRPKYGDIVWVQEDDGLQAAEAVHHNYEPAIHRRVVAIVGGAFLLVLDHVRDLGAERSVQIYYHLDSPDVTWNPDQRVSTTANPDVNVAVFASPNVRGTLLEGRVSDFLDVARPSTRLCLEDATPPSETTRIYAAVIVPYRATASAPSLTVFDLALDGAQIRCWFTLNGRTYVFVWHNGGLDRTA